MGRRLLFVGLVLLTVGIITFLAIVLLAPESGLAHRRPAVHLWARMGCWSGPCSRWLFGDIADSEAGSASRALNAARQIADAALISSTSLSIVAAATGRTGLALCLAIVLLGAVLSLAVLPRRAANVH